MGVLLFVFFSYLGWMDGGLYGKVLRRTKVAVTDNNSLMRHIWSNVAAARTRVTYRQLLAGQLNSMGTDRLRENKRETN